MVPQGGGGERITRGKGHWSSERLQRITTCHSRGPERGHVSPRAECIRVAEPDPELRALRAVPPRSQPPSGAGALVPTWPGLSVAHHVPKLLGISSGTEPEFGPGSAGPQNRRCAPQGCMAFRLPWGAVSHLPAWGGWHWPGLAVRARPALPLLVALPASSASQLPRGWGRGALACGEHLERVPTRQSAPGRCPVFKPQSLMT